MILLTLCEKHSQAKAIADALGFRKAKESFEGTYGGDTWIVTWAAGHLLEPVTPDKAKADINWVDPDSLLPVPSFPKMVISRGNAKTIDRIKALSKKCEGLIVATDPDREGEGIGREIIEHIKFKPKLTKRLWLVAGMDKVSIEKAASKLRDGSETIAMWRAQQARANADWMSQITTRLMTMAARRDLFGPNVASGKKGASVASVGRVQTPTLNIIVIRDLEIEAFTPKTYYTPVLVVDQDGTTGELTYDHPITKSQLGDHIPGVTWMESDKGLRPIFTDKALADAFAARINGIVGSNVDLKTVRKDKFKKPPLTFSLTKLQQHLNRSKKMTAAKTLKAAQNLYTNGHISYPRTEHEFLPNEAWADAPAVMAAIAKMGGSYSVASGLPKKPADGHLPGTYTGKGMEHHGIMPTTKTPNLMALGPDERNAYEAIVERYIESHLPAAKLEALTVTTNAPVEGFVSETPSKFSVSGERVVDAGWMAPFQGSKATKDSLPNLKNGAAAVSKGHCKTEKTKPPARFTEASLLEAMKNAGRFAEDAEAAKMLKSVQGIGTPATRDSIIETLLRRDYLNRKGKYIQSTIAGRDLIKHLPDDAKSVEKTAQWESELGDIAGLTDAAAVKARDAFIQMQTDNITGLINMMKPRISGATSRRAPASSGSKKGSKKMGAPTEKMITFAKSVETRSGVAIPEGTLDDFDKTKEYLDANAGSGGSSAGAASSNGPTPKQLAFAEKLAGERKLTLSEDQRTQYDACKSFIDECMASPVARPPSEKMVNFARKIAERNNIEIPQGLPSDYNICKQFLDQHAG